MLNSDLLIIAYHVGEGTWWIVALRPLGSHPVSGPYPDRMTAESALETLS